jgi:hypothetical protein
VVAILAQPDLVHVDEVPQLFVAADLPGAGVEHRDLAGPGRLERARVAVVQRREELPHGIFVPLDASLLVRQLGGVDEVREPRHLDPRSFSRADTRTPPCLLGRRGDSPEGLTSPGV